MSRRILILALLAVLTAAAADVTGTWKADFTTPDGTARSNTFKFKAEGSKLTGTVSGGQDETPITNGKISGDDISFTADRPFGTFTYAGKISGDEIKLKVTFNDNSFDIVAKRAGK